MAAVRALNFHTRNSTFTITQPMNAPREKVKSSASVRAPIVATSTRLQAHVLGLAPGEEEQAVRHGVQAAEVVRVHAEHREERALRGERELAEATGPSATT